MHIGEFNLVHTNELNAGRRLPQNDSLLSRHPPMQHGDPTAKAHYNDLSENIKEAINSSLVHKLFSALSRSESSLFKNYNSDIDDSQSRSSNHDGDFTKAFGVTHSEFSSSDLSLTLGSGSPGTESFSQTLFFSQVMSMETNISVNNDSLTFNTTQTNVQSSSLEVDITADQQQADPLILDLDFNGFAFSSKSQNIEFDLNADGQLDSISALKGEDAFLAIDVNKNGKIDNGLELFGDARGAKDGFAELRRFDLNGDSIIDAQDRIYDQLLLLSFTDNGEQQISRLTDQDIKSISLDSIQENLDYENANQLVSSAGFEKSNGDKGIIGDFLLGIGVS